MVQLYISNNQKNKFTNIEDYHTKIYTATEESVDSIGKGQIKMKINVSNRNKNDKIKRSSISTQF